MKPSEKNNRLDQLLTEALGGRKKAPNFEAWKQQHPRAVETITSGAAKASPVPIWRIIMESKYTKLAVAAAIIVAIGVFLFQQQPSDGSPTHVSFWGQVCAAEVELFDQDGIVHIVNEIVVYADPKAGQGPEEKSPWQSDLDTVSKFIETNWLPLCSLNAEGGFDFNQLKLQRKSEDYVVRDESLYDPLTGHFRREMRVDGMLVFANGFDGDSVYTLTDGHVVDEPVDESWAGPSEPAEFLGLTAGLRGHIDGDKALNSIEDQYLADGTHVQAVKYGFRDLMGYASAYWEVRVRSDDSSIAEMEFFVRDEPVMLIRRVTTETVEFVELTAPEDLEQSVEMESDLVSVEPGMVIPKVSVQEMVENADYETYVFARNPSWTNYCEITDCIDPPSPGHRMYIAAYRADDGRHVVMVQCHTYNTMFGKFVRQGQCSYESPKGFKVWSGGPSKWYAGILLEAASDVIQDEPAADRIGFVVETPSGTFPAVAVNGSIIDAELRELVDSLIPATEYVEEAPVVGEDSSEPGSIDFNAMGPVLQETADEVGPLPRDVEVDTEDELAGIEQEKSFDQVVTYAIDVHRKATEVAATEGAWTNTIVTFVDENMQRFGGGILCVSNGGSVPMTGEIRVMQSNGHDMAIFDRSGRELDIRWEKWKLFNPGRHRGYWTPDEPIAPGETRYLYYRGLNASPLHEDTDGRYSLRMGNFPGSRCMESFILVLPENVLLDEATEDPMSETKLPGQNVYVWQKMVPNDTNHTVDIKLIFDTGELIIKPSSTETEPVPRSIEPQEQDTLTGVEMESDYSNAIAYAIGVHQWSLADSSRKGAWVNTHIHNVSSEMKNVHGGITGYTNHSSEPLTGEIKIMQGNSPEMAIFDQDGNLLDIRWLKWKPNNPGSYRGYWLPDEPLQPGGTRYFHWRGLEARPLGEAEFNTGYKLRMRNFPGSRCLESFVLVLEPGVLLADASEPPTDRVDIAEQTVYVWRKLVPDNTEHRVDVWLESSFR